MTTCATPHCYESVSPDRAAALLSRGKDVTCMPCARTASAAVRIHLQDEHRVPLGVPMPSNGFGR